VEDSHFLAECIGHVAGICQFRDYLRDTHGMRVMRCLMDIRRFHRYVTSDNPQEYFLIQEPIKQSVGVFYKYIHPPTLSFL
jgi:hypothetical protein